MYYIIILFNANIIGFFHVKNTSYTFVLKYLKLIENLPIYGFIFCLVYTLWIEFLFYIFTYIIN